MINFSKFLNEARMAPLYHATTMANLYDIFLTNGLDRRTTQDVSKLNIPNEDKAKIKYGRYGNESVALCGVSLTRNLRFAKQWSMNAVIEFDQNELNKRFRIRPFNFFQSFESARLKGMTKDTTWNTPASDASNEYEEFLLLPRNTILPLKYATQIYIKKQYEDALIQLMQKTGTYIPYVTY